MNFLSTQNDEPPKFVRREWNASMPCHPYVLNSVILTILVKDADLLETNAFAYKILNDSAFASQFTVRTDVNGSGSLIPLPSLNLSALRAQENGINLTIYVSDNGVFVERDHVDSARVYVKCDNSVDKYRFQVHKSNRSVSDEVRRQFHIGSESRQLDYDFEKSSSSTELSHQSSDVFFFPNKCHYFPCRNGATCINFANGSFVCVCVNGFFGAFCDNAHVSYKILLSPLSFKFLGNFTYYIIGFATLIVLLLSFICCVIIRNSNLSDRNVIYVRPSYIPLLNFK